MAGRTVPVVDAGGLYRHCGHWSLYASVGVVARMHGRPHVRSPRLH